MKLRLLTLISFLGLYSAQAAPVSSSEALRLAKQFLQGHGVQVNALSIDSITNGRTNVMYYMNAPMKGGFVLMSADDRALPILGYSTTNNFETTDAPSNLVYWLKGYKSEINYVISHNSKPDAETATKWAELRNNKTKPNSGRVASVAPLLRSTWNQSPYYNDACPRDPRTGERAVVGCVATAMSQVMRYHQYPSKGVGFYSYRDANFGVQSANFGTTTYRWTDATAPLAALGTANANIATICYHAGVAVNMSYGVASTGGSGAYTTIATSPVTNCAEYALKTYFGYKSTMSSASRAANSTTSWYAILRRELDARRPVMYDGSGTGGGHSFVCDGYTDTDLFHFNWGWGGSSDGNFACNALNPGSLGAGGGSGGFNSGQNVIIGIQPANPNGFAANPTLKMLSSFGLSNNTIQYNSPISGSGTIYNKDSVAFNGKLMAAITNSNNVFIAGIDTISVNIPSRQRQNNVTFSSPGSLAMIPGTFQVSVFYRKSDTSQWIMVGDSNTFTNSANLTVLNQSDIQIYNDFLNPDTFYRAQQPLNISVNMINNGPTDWRGDVSLEIVDIQGNTAQVIERKSNLSLGRLGQIFDTELTFSTDLLTVLPGNYLMQLRYTNGGITKLVGNGNGSNPALISVQGVILTPDSYEPNNTPATATTLTVTGSGTTSSCKTIGSNIHRGTDVDFYKFVLPNRDYLYTFRPKIQDKYYLVGTDSVYTVDGIFSYSTDNGVTFSNTFDDVTDSAIVLRGGGTVMIKVATQLAGNTGSYKLSVLITSRPLATDANIAIAPATIYPNPTKGSMTVSAPLLTNGIISIMNTAGKLITTLPQYAAEQNISLEGMPAGVYLVNLKGEERNINLRLVVE